MYSTFFCRYFQSKLSRSNGDEFATEILSKPVLVLAIEEYFNSPTLDTLAMLYDSLNAMDLSLMPKLSLLERHILQASSAKDLFVEKFERMISQQKEDDDDSGVADRLASGENTPQSAGFRQALPRDTHEYESRIKFNNHSVPVKIPTAKSAETVGSFSIIKLIQVRTSELSMKKRCTDMSRHSPVRTRARLSPLLFTRT